MQAIRINRFGESIYRLQPVTHGTLQRSFRWIEATGNEVTVEPFSSRRLHNGVIVETKSAADMVDLLDQLDAEIPLDT